MVDQNEKFNSEPGKSYLSSKDHSYLFCLLIESFFTVVVDYKGQRTNLETNSLEKI